jgi:hypothetical protein
LVGHDILEVPNVHHAGAIWRNLRIGDIFQVENICEFHGGFLLGKHCGAQKEQAEKKRRKVREAFHCDGVYDSS